MRAIHKVSPGTQKTDPAPPKLPAHTLLAVAGTPNAAQARF